MNSGLYAFAGDSATATAAACANRLDEPMTNVSNVYFGLSRLPPRRRGRAGPGRRCRPRGRWSAGRCGPARPSVGPVPGRGRIAAGRRGGESARRGGAVGRGRPAAGGHRPSGDQRARRLAASARRRVLRPRDAVRRGRRRRPSGGGLDRSYAATRARRVRAAAGRRPSARCGATATATVGAGDALRRPSSGGRTVTATWTGRPSCRESASVIAGRSRDSMTSRVNASGTDEQGGVLDDRPQPGQAQVGALLRGDDLVGELVGRGHHTAARSIVSVTVAPPPSLVSRHRPPALPADGSSRPARASAVSTGVPAADALSTGCPQPVYPPIVPAG